MAFLLKQTELKENRDLTEIKNRKLKLDIWLDSIHYKLKLFQRESTFFFFFIFLSLIYLKFDRDSAEALTSL